EVMALCTWKDLCFEACQFMRTRLADLIRGIQSPAWAFCWQGGVLRGLKRQKTDVTSHTIPVIRWLCVNVLKTCVYPLSIHLKRKAFLLAQSRLHALDQFIGEFSRSRKKVFEGTCVFLRTLRRCRNRRFS